MHLQTLWEFMWRESPLLRIQLCSWMTLPCLTSVASTSQFHQPTFKWGGILSTKCGIHRLAKTLHKILRVQLFLSPYSQNLAVQQNSAKYVICRLAKQFPVSHTSAIQNHPTATFPQNQKSVKYQEQVDHQLGNSWVVLTCLPSAPSVPGWQNFLVLKMQNQEAAEKYLSPGNFNVLIIRVWRTGTGNSRYQEFLIFLVVSEPESEKIGTGKKSRNRYRKNLVPERKYRNRYRKN